MRIWEEKEHQAGHLDSTVLQTTRQKFTALYHLSRDGRGEMETSQWLLYDETGNKHSLDIAYDDPSKLLSFLV